MKAVTINSEFNLSRLNMLTITHKWDLEGSTLLPTHPNLLAFVVVVAVLYMQAYSRQ